MQTWIRIFFCIITIPCITTTDAQFFDDSEKPPNLKGKVGWEARMSYVSYSGDKHFEPKGRVMVSGSFTFFTHEMISLEFEAGYIGGRLELKYGVPSPVDIGDLRQVPLLFSLRWHAPVSSNMSSYFLGGVGYFINNFDQDPILGEAARHLYGSGTRFYINNSTGLHIGIGVEYSIEPQSTINFEIRHIWTDPEMGVVDDFRTFLMSLQEPVPDVSALVTAV